MEEFNKWGCSVQLSKDLRIKRQKFNSRRYHTLEAYRTAS
jgi:hypothetical protein